MNNVTPDYIPAKVISQYVYCPRSFYLQWVNGEFEHSADTMEGLYLHKQVDSERTYTEHEIIHETSSLLSSEKHKIIARMDLIKLSGNIAIPIDYKKGKCPENDEIKESDKAQLCAQAIVLRDNGYVCNGGFIYYIGSKRKMELFIDDDLINWTLKKTDEIREIASAGVIPEPPVDDMRCTRCSLTGICLPDEISALNNNQKEEVRRLYPARPDKYPLIIQKHGAFVSKSGEEIVVKENGEKVANARFIDVSDISVFGYAQVSTQLIHELLNRKIPLSYFSAGGWYQGSLFSSMHKNIELRMAQYNKAQNSEASLSLAKEFVIGKIKNCRTLLKRNINPIEQSILNQLSNTAISASKAKSIDQLMGFEGNGASIYFSNFSKLIKESGNNKDYFKLSNRNKRPPKDPINALLSYAYTLLVKEFFVTIIKVGLDPYLGFLHSPKYGRASLALDLMEEFRPIICDSTVITAINNGEITEKHFDVKAGGVLITDNGRRIFLESFYRRLDTLITHPIFNYKVSYKRIFEIQTRLLGRVLTGEIKEYPSFTTR